MTKDTILAGMELAIRGHRGWNSNPTTELNGECELIVTINDWYGSEHNAQAKEARLVFGVTDYGDFKTLFEAYGSRGDYGLGGTEWYAAFQYLVGVRDDLPKYVKEFIRALV